ncbi:hypothetical protein AJ87_23005 [Rhizobium yanglingense]|nr:hypothetical protein AJ87_23005 [Rhizobium yanglingense]
MIAMMRCEPRSGQKSLEFTRRKCGATMTRSSVLPRRWRAQRRPSRPGGFRSWHDLDAPADAVCACGRRDLEGLALIGIDFRRRGQIERGVVAGNLHGFRRLRNACSQCKHRQEKSCDHRDQSAGR